MLGVGVPGVIAGVITEAVSLLFFHRADTANKRADQYHQELLQIRQLDNLIAACDELRPGERQEKCKEQVIEAATMQWFHSVSRDR
jgi:hypothetical protein